MSEFGDLVSREAERMVAPLPALVYVAFRGPLNMRVLGVYSTLEAAKQRCAEHCGKASSGTQAITWTEQKTPGSWSSQVFAATDGGSVRYYAVEAEVQE